MQRTIMWQSIAVAGLMLWSTAPAIAQQEQPSRERRYNGLIAGEEAYQRSELRRQAEIGRQYDLNADMYWRWSGANSWLPGAFEPWPMVPGSIWGWPAAASPPHYTPVGPVPFVPPNRIVPQRRSGPREF